MKKLFVCLLILPILSACGLSSTKAGFTAIYSDVKKTDDVVKIDSSSFTRGTKEGKACGINVLYVVALGDMTIDAAKKDGNISNITSVYTETKNRIIMSEVCTIVRGN